MTMNSPPSSSIKSSGFERLSEPVRRWIWSKGWDELRDIQEQAIAAILDTQDDVIISASTAGGKTEAAFLPIISSIADQQGKGFKALYISPLKALINDQFRRLEDLCEMVHLPVFKWHGDVSDSIKRKARTSPDGIVLITPESLEALFVRRGQEVGALFGPTQFVVIDELHAFIGQERGKQLQSLLARLESAAGHSMRRIGLSATLGNMELAGEFLRPRPSGNVRILRGAGGSGTLRLQIRGYQRLAAPVNPVSEPQEEPNKEEKELAFMRQISSNVFAAMRGANGLVFAGSRASVELYSDLLRQASKEIGVPEEFFPHHANLSKDHREFVEERLRSGREPTTAVCTSTLELGIDIGAIESVAQIGVPWSVSSLRQRLGRSGRRDAPSILRIYIAEREWTNDLHPADALRCQLVQSIAMIRLLVESWFEPPSVGALHLSTLAHQILAVIAQHGGASAIKIYNALCANGAFGSVSQDQFVRTLRALGAPESKLVEQLSDGTLLLGAIGERLVDHYDFYSVFVTAEEYQVVWDGKVLGTLPIVTAIAPEMTIIFSGRRWSILEIRDREKVVVVVPSSAGVPPLFGGEGGDLDDRIVQEMREIYEEADIPPFLDQTAAKLLEEGRNEYHRLELGIRGAIEKQGDVYLFPWSGSLTASTLALALKAQGLDTSVRGIVLEVPKQTVAGVQRRLRTLAAAAAPNAIELASNVSNLIHAKYDPYLPQDLLVEQYAADRIRAKRVPVIAKQLLSSSEDKETART
jgi:ATP-dependent helicase Lhr and Lhr-like helicase